MEKRAKRFLIYGFLVLLVFLLNFVVGCIQKEVKYQGVFQLTTAPGRDADPSWCSNDKIVYWSTRTGNGDIYLVNIDGTNETRLTNSSAKEIDPACSPDGTKIVYAVEEQGSINLWIINIDGSENKQLTTDMGNWPSWSPSEDKIAYSSNGDIWIMDADGSNKTRLTSSPEMEYAPCFSPDGSQIIYSKGEPGGGDPLNPSKGSADLWIMNVDGSNQRLFFSSEGEQVCFQEGWRQGKIVYMDANTPHPTVWIMDEDGSNKRQLFSSSNCANGDPALSPDGKMIAWMSNKNGNDDIWIAHIE